jgi:nitrogen fixation/metabolism regulation signal transduction histidine kinase
MGIKRRLLLITFVLHGFLLIGSLLFLDELGALVLVVELVLLLSLIMFIWLINKSMQPMEYLTLFSSMLKEGEFNAQFSKLGQTELDQLVTQFNIMLSRLYEERLLVGEQRGVLQQLMKESPVGVLLLDFEDRIDSMNPASEKLLDVVLEKVKGTKLHVLTGSVVAVIKQVPTGQQQTLVTASGQQLKIGHFTLKDRGFSRSFYLIHELTGDLMQAQRSAYEKLIRLMSHEVNNTLAITNSLLESCKPYHQQLTSEDSADYQQAIDIVMERSKNLNTFMKTYADVVKMPELRVSNYNLSQQLENLLILFFAECEKRQITIQKNIASDTYVVADAHLMEQALMNVIKNAMEAIDQSGQMEVNLINRSDHVELSVIDSGEGIAPETQKQLFAPFYTTKESGQGVGLMLIQDVLQQHQFSFRLQNRDDAKGACFQIEIPCFSE